MVLGFSGSIQVETKTSFQAPGDDSSDMRVNPSKETLIAKPVDLHLSGHHDNHLGMFPQYASDKRRFIGIPYLQTDLTSLLLMAEILHHLGYIQPCK